jgi:hypothetical protein
MPKTVTAALAEQLDLPLPLCLRRNPAVHFLTQKYGDTILYIMVRQLPLLSLLHSCPADWTPVIQTSDVTEGLRQRVGYTKRNSVAAIHTYPNRPHKSPTLSMRSCCRRAPETGYHRRSSGPFPPRPRLLDGVSLLPIGLRLLHWKRMQSVDAATACARVPVLVRRAHLA